jgi:hypothetical protein
MYYLSERQVAVMSKHQSPHPRMEMKTLFCEEKNKKKKTYVYVSE